MLDRQVCRKARATVLLASIVHCRQSEEPLCAECAATTDLGAPFAIRPPAEDRPGCRSCGHANQENWDLCSACGAMREP